VVLNVRQGGTQAGRQYDDLQEESALNPY
jgi:hypothetical protein